MWNKAVMVYLGCPEVPKTKDWCTAHVGLWEFEYPHAHCNGERGWAISATHRHLLDTVKKKIQTKECGLECGWHEGGMGMGRGWEWDEDGGGVRMGMGMETEMGMGMGKRLGVG